MIMLINTGFPRGAGDKQLTSQYRRRKRHGFNPWIRKIPWRRAWQPTPVFLPRESQGQRSLVGNCLWGHKELAMTEVTQHAHKKHSTTYKGIQQMVLNLLTAAVIQKTYKK